VNTELLRRRAFSIAYRMLGTVSEAEDIVQEALLRAHQTPAIENPQAFITTVTTRLAITELQSARVRRESYVGDWLPEPVLTADDPSVVAETSEAVSLALLTALETLTPAQRAALLLHDVFDYGYPQIAEVLDVTAANARQLVARARRLVSSAPRFTPDRGQHAELVQRFLAAAEEGDLAGLEHLLAEEVLMRGDGGGKVPALGRTVAGRARVAKTLVNGVRAFGSMPGLSWQAVEVNGAPGAVYRDGSGALIAVLALEVADGRVVSVDSVANPDKLRHLGPVGDVHALLRAAHPERRG
jgi:RNA polymerase sigma-70 factor (ECF subfamily)